jgi:hypothetical protein
MKAKMKLALAKSAHKSAVAAPAKSLPVKINSQKKGPAVKAAKKEAPVSLAQV